MAEEIAIRSEEPSLESLRKTLDVISKDGTKDTDEIASLLLLAAELYGDARCRCEEKEVSYGEGEEEVVACDRNLGRARQEMLDAYRRIIDSLKSGG